MKESNQPTATAMSLDELTERIGGVINEQKDLVVINRIRFDQSYLNKSVRSEASAILLCMQGRLKISSGMQEYNLQENSVMMYGSQNIIEIQEMDEDCVMSIVVFTNDFLQETMLDMKSIIPIFQYFKEKGTGMLCLTPNEKTILADFYDLMGKTIHFDKPSINHDLMSAFVRTLSVMYSRRVVECQMLRTRHEEYLDKFMNAVHEHHKKYRSVKFYADTLHITPKYLSSVIKEVSGRSATEWIDDFVVREAKTLLKFSSKSVQEITYSLNFSTQSFFGKYFKRHTGMSPSEYRMRN